MRLSSRQLALVSSLIALAWVVSASTAIARTWTEGDSTQAFPSSHHSNIEIASVATVRHSATLSTTDHSGVPTVTSLGIAYAVASQIGTETETETGDDDGASVDATIGRAAHHARRRQLARVST